MLHTKSNVHGTSGIEVIKLEFILRLKIKRNDWLLADTCQRQQIIALYIECETVLRFYNLEGLVLKKRLLKGF